MLRGAAFPTQHRSALSDRVQLLAAIRVAQTKPKGHIPTVPNDLVRQQCKWTERSTRSEPQYRFEKSVVHNFAHRSERPHVPHSATTLPKVTALQKMAPTFGCYRMIPFWRPAAMQLTAVPSGSELSTRLQTAMSVLIVPTRRPFTVWTMISLP